LFKFLSQPEEPFSRELSVESPSVPPIVHQMKVSLPGIAGADHVSLHEPSLDEISTWKLTVSPQLRLVGSCTVKWGEELVPVDPAVMLL